MKTAIIQPNDFLRNLVSYTRQFSESVEVQTVEEILKEKKIEVIISEQRDLQSNDIIQLRNTFPNQKIFIVADYIEPFFEKSCITHDVLLISKEWGERERLDLIQKTWFGLEEQTEYHNVVAIHGTHRQVGVTQLALSIGHTLGTFNYKTLVIGMNPYNPGELSIRKTNYTFDQVYDLIQSNVIYDGDSLLPYLDKHDHFYYLPGNLDFYKATSFEEKPIERLIHFAKEHFHIVLLDIGAFYDSYLSIVGMKLSNTHILVSSQDQISLDEYKRWKEQVLSRFDFHPKSTYQVVNKYASKATLQLKHLEETHEVPILTHVDFFPEANDAVIHDGILAYVGWPPFNRVIEGIARAIGDEVLATTNYEKKDKSIFSIFSRRNAK
jgi:hypothetical protein